MQRTISIIITGKVQGVFFRQSAKEKALELGLSGEAKNLRDGNVHIVASGNGEQLAAFTDWCKQSRHLPLKLFFERFRAKLRGYYNYYGIHGNRKQRHCDQQLDQRKTSMAYFHI